MPELAIDVIRSAVVIFALLTGMAYMTWFERRAISRLQVRIGPNRTGAAGRLRAAAQLVSYELIIGLALVGVVIVGGSLSLGDLVDRQTRSVPFVLLQPLGFLLYLIAAVAEVNRAPFDLPEADTELVAGYHTE